ncbi:hypothetical protein [Pedobacter steynii]
MARPTTYVDPSDMSGELIPYSNTLVGDDIFESRDVFIKPNPVVTELSLNWKLLSKHFKKQGVLKIKIESEIKTVNKQITVEDPADQKRVPGEFEDFIEYIN